MIVPVQAVKNQELRQTLKEQSVLFPETSDEMESTTDLISQINSNIEELEDLCGRLSFSLREVSQVLKVKNT